MFKQYHSTYNMKYSHFYNTILNTTLDTLLIYRCMGGNCHRQEQTANTVVWKSCRVSQCWHYDRTKYSWLHWNKQDCRENIKQILLAKHYMGCEEVLQNLLSCTVVPSGSSRGRCWHVPPKGPDSFLLTIFSKCSCLPYKVSAPHTGNPGSTTGTPPIADETETVMIKGTQLQIQDLS